MKYQVEKQNDDGSWRVYRDGQTLNSATAALRLISRLMDRYGAEHVRVAAKTE